MASLAVPTENCLACAGMSGFEHNKNDPSCSQYIVPTVASKQEAAKKKRSEEKGLAEKRAAITVENLTYDITEEEQQEWGGIRDKIITVRIFDEENVIGEWSIYFYFKDGKSIGSGDAHRRFEHTADLAYHISIEEAYQKLGLSRFMGKKLSDKITGMIKERQLSVEDLFFINYGDSSLGFWESIGMKTQKERKPPREPQVAQELLDKWMYVKEFISWANGTKQGTKHESITRLNHLLEHIEKRVHLAEEEKREQENEENEEKREGNLRKREKREGNLRKRKEELKEENNIRYIFKFLNKIENE